VHDLAHSRLRDSQPLSRGDLGLAATPDVARDLQRQIAAQRLDGAGIGIRGHSVFTITLANTLWQSGNWLRLSQPPSLLRQTIHYDLAITEWFYYLYSAHIRDLAYGPVIYTQHIPGLSISFWNSPAADRSIA